MRGGREDLNLEEVSGNLDAASMTMQQKMAARRRRMEESLEGNPDEEF